jgi:uncharacterized protein YprB with RNaseH-like and TPR domain
MKIFFDTEFTGLHKNTTLISIGLVDENGRTFYAEFSDYADNQCNEWIYKNVIKNLKWSKAGLSENFANIYANDWEAYGTKEYIKTVLIDWLSKYDNVELISDVCHYDMVLFIDIFGTAFDIPSNVSPVCHDINQDISEYYNITDAEAFDKNREEILEQFGIVIEGNKHNSLYDAKVIKQLYIIM